MESHCNNVFLMLGLLKALLLASSFLLYMNGVPDDVNSNIAIYADDIALTGIGKLICGSCVGL